METASIIFVICLVVAIFVGYLFFYFKDKDRLNKRVAEEKEDKELKPLRLQAYERLVLLTERIGLPNLVSRSNHPGLSAQEMQFLLIQTTKQEFDHNVSQQIYVTPRAWEAVRTLKEQNMLIINQVASFLPATATGADLNKALMDLLVQNPDASLHNVVSEALSFEAKKLLGSK